MKFIGAAWLFVFFGCIALLIVTEGFWMLPVLTGLALFPIILLLVDMMFKTHMSCDAFGWHNGSGGTQSFDGCSVHTTCSKCGKSVMQDSQGNWF